MKHVRIVRSWLPEGLEVASLGRGSHPLTIIVVETGELLRDVDGRRIAIPSSPSDVRALKNLRVQVRKALAARGVA